MTSFFKQRLKGDIIHAVAILKSPSLPCIFLELVSFRNVNYSPPAMRLSLSLSLSGNFIPGPFAASAQTLSSILTFQLHSLLFPQDSFARWNFLPVAIATMWAIPAFQSSAPERTPLNTLQNLPERSQHNLVKSHCWSHHDMIIKKTII